MKLTPGRIDVRMLMNLVLVNINELVLVTTRTH
jgi:hypothetical protein